MFAAAFGTQSGLSVMLYRATYGQRGWTGFEQEGEGGDRCEGLSGTRVVLVVPLPKVTRTLFGRASAHIPLRQDAGDQNIA